jgi:phosphopantothenoylcysteine synthetase/decarboxylase
MADCKQEQEDFNDAFGQMADSLFDMATAKRIENDAEKATIATGVGAATLRYMYPLKPDVVAKLEDGFRASVEAMQLSQKMGNLAKGMFDRAKGDFEKAVKDLCHCWESGDGGESQNLAGDTAALDDDDDDDDDDDEEFDEMEDEAEGLLSDVDDIMEEVEELLTGALDDEGEDEAADVALVG